MRNHFGDSCSGTKMRFDWRRKVVPVLAIVCGCAHTPKGAVSYYFPKATTQFLITQTLTCNSNGDRVFQALTVTPTTVYSSDFGATPGRLSPRSLDGYLTDTDLAFNFTDDGRLT